MEKKFCLQTLNDDPMFVQILSDYAYLIKCIAQKIALKLPPNIDFDDLFSAGVIGFMDAVEKYDPTRENKFKTYAEFRIRGAIIDELRSQDWLPRSVRDLHKLEDRAKSELERKFCRPASESEVADHLKISLSEYRDRNTKNHVFLVNYAESQFINAHEKSLSTEDTDSSNSKNPLSILTQKRAQKTMAKAIDELPEKQKMVLTLYYFEELNLKEIGKILDITESRVSQIHSAAVKRMRIKLRDME